MTADDKIAELEHRLGIVEDRGDRDRVATVKTSA